MIREPTPWHYSERSHHVCYQLLQLLFWWGLSHYWSLCDLGKRPYIAYISESPHCLCCILEVSLVKASKSLMNLICSHLSHSHVSSAWGLLNLELVPNGTTHCFVSPSCLQFPSHILQHLVVLSYYCWKHNCFITYTFVGPIFSRVMNFCSRNKKRFCLIRKNNFSKMREKQ